MVRTVLLLRARMSTKAKPLIPEVFRKTIQAAVNPGFGRGPGTVRTYVSCRAGRGPGLARRVRQHASCNAPCAVGVCHAAELLIIPFLNSLSEMQHTGRPMQGDKVLLYCSDIS